VNKALIALLLILSGTAANGDEIVGHEKAYQLQSSGEIRPLESFIKDAQSRHAGHVIEVELEYHGDMLVYEVEMLDETGKVTEYIYNAKTGEVLAIDINH
jgi:uncharacterized membrane protein YkoI